MPGIIRIKIILFFLNPLNFHEKFLAVRNSFKRDLVNKFGGLMWTAAPFTIFAGVTTDYIASRFSKAGSQRSLGTIKAVIRI